MLVQPHFSKFTLPELINYFKGYYSFSNDNNKANGLSLAAFIALANKGLLPMEAAYAYQKDSPETQELIASDTLRDEDLVGILLYAESFTHHFNPVFRAAAHTIINCFNNYGKRIHKLAYAIETEIVSKLVNDLENDTVISAAVTTLNLGDWVTHLKNTNSRFSDKYIARTQAYATKPAQPATALKPAAILAFTALEQQINSNSNPEIDTEGKFVKLVNELNAHTNLYNTNAAKRIGTAAANAAKDDANVKPD
jgi:hypothetical protein